MKKLFVAVIGLFVLFDVTACSNETTSNPSTILYSTEEVYGFEAVSSITLLNGFGNDANQTSINVKPLFNNYKKLGFKKEVTADEIDEINKYLGIMEQMLADEEPISVVNETSDRAEYSNKMVISTKDLNLNVYTYVLYFNEVELSKEVEETEENEFDDEEVEDEVESSLQGIMIVGVKEYSVTGKKELEENEMKVEFTSKIDENNWVTVKQKTENNESKFEYTISENGVKSVTEVKFEKEDDETKLKLQFKQGDNKSEYQFKIEEEDGQKIIKIEIEDETNKIEVKVFVVVDPLTGDVSYEYRVKDSDKSFKKDRENAHDDNDDDNDDDIDDDNDDDISDDTVDGINDDTGNSEIKL